MSLAQGIRAGAAYIELSTKDSRLAKGLEAASLKLRAFGASINAVGRHAAAIGVGISASLLGAAKLFADIGSNLLDTSERTGFTVEALSELAFAAQQAGADLETLETGVRKMQKFIVEAASGSAEARDTLARLGLTFQELAALAPDDQLKLIADRLQRIENPALRTATALAIFGKTGTKLLPLLNEGAKGIEALQEQARRLGLTMTRQEAEAADALGDTIDALTMVLKKSAATIGAALVPTLIEAAQWIMGTARRVAEWIKQNQGLVVTLLKIGGALLVTGLGLMLAGKLISGFGVALGIVSTILSGVGTVVSVLGTILAAVLTPIGAVIAAVVALGAYLVTATDTGSKVLDWLAGRFTELKTTALAAWKGIGDALVAGDLGLAARILWLTLKMEWQRGVNALHAAWLNFKGMFVEIFYRAVYGIMHIANDAWAGLQVAWVETTTFMANSWTRFISVLQTGWNRFGGFFRRVWERIKAVFTDEDPEEQIRRINVEVADENRAIQERADETVREREQNRQRRRAEIEQNRAQFEAQINEDQANERALRERRNQEQLREGEAALEELRRQWRGALDEAARIRGEADAGKPPMLARPKPLGNIDELLDLAKNKIEAKGTFNPFAASGLGADSLSERTARATELTAANTKKFLDHMKDGKLVFL